jgi:hypothetical protein
MTKEQAISKENECSNSLKGNRFSSKLKNQIYQVNNVNHLKDSINENEFDVYVSFFEVHSDKNIFIENLVEKLDFFLLNYTLISHE